jgi:Tfp pilus assembly pilus retraction ATPase PilT
VRRAACTMLLNKPYGIVLVVGPTGSGKSTTLAAMIDRINDTKPVHILTIEDPVEYLHHHKLAMVNQREVGTDVGRSPTACAVPFVRTPTWCSSVRCATSTRSRSR